MRRRTYDEARRSVGAASGWRLPAEEWPAVETALARLERALHEPDQDLEIRRATGALDMAGPITVRAISAADLAGDPAPATVRERIVRLVESLDAPPPATEADTG